MINNTKYFNFFIFILYYLSTNFIIIISYLYINIQNIPSSLYIIKNTMNIISNC